ncbi:MAG: hypothetical protein KJN66_06525 [Bacteroidia bacterium]|nr:hypothetical protein [Bacteroidia bacterium]
MQTITKYLSIIILSLCIQFINAQETTAKEDQIQLLEEKKEIVRTQEKDKLKSEVESINIRLENGEITNEEAEKLKKKYAQKRALNIENRIAIIDNKIALLNRNKEDDVQIDVTSSGYYLRIGGSEDSNTNDEFIYFGKRNEDKPRRYDRRTTSDLVFAIGFNNALIDGEKLDDSPYKLGGSGFVELGWAWKTRILENSNAIRLKYGFSFVWNKLDIKDNNYLVNNDGVITLEEFPTNLKKAKFRMTNLVFPVHFEFGPSKKIERDTYFRYSTSNKFKIGLGGYGGFNIATLQKLKYKVDDRNAKDKFKDGYKTSNLVYGLSGYLAFDDVALYVKYDLSPIFKDQPVDQNNISLGLRFDMD